MALMGIFGWIGMAITFVLGLPFIIIGVIGAGLSHLFVSGIEKVDQAATNGLGETYTKPRNALVKALVAVVVIAVVVWLLWMCGAGFSGGDCDYGRTGERCYPY